MRLKCIKNNYTNYPLFYFLTVGKEYNATQNPKCKNTVKLKNDQGKIRSYNKALFINLSS